MRAKNGRTLKSQWQYLTGHPVFRQSPASISFRLFAWALRCAFGIPAVIEFPRWVVRIFLPPQWRGLAKIAFLFRERYEPELGYLERVLSPGKVAVDVGASLGIYTVVAGKLVGASGRVISFEPAAAAFALLQRNLKLNNLLNVQAFRLALSDRAGIASLYHHPDPSRNSLGRSSDFTGEGEEIDTQTLDTVLSMAVVDHVDFIKMDVEGAEELVLRGAMLLLRGVRPTVLFEVQPEAASRLGLSRSGAWDVLASLGYEFFTLTESGELVALNSPPDYGNVIAICKAGG